MGVGGVEEEVSMMIVLEGSEEPPLSTLLACHNDYVHVFSATTSITTTVHITMAT